jgi:hypothetical protein
MNSLRLLRWYLVLGAAFSVAAGSWGCSTSSELAGADSKLTGNVGQYAAVPASVTRPPVGVPAFNVATVGGFGGGADLNDLAADQLDTLLYKTTRVDVVVRSQLKKLVYEQSLEGVVRLALDDAQGAARHR